MHKIRMIALGFLALVAGLVGLTVHTTKSDKYLARATVAIMNAAQNSGGTGSILFSTPMFSRILTNRHVCELLKTGGVVIDDNGGKHAVLQYTPSTTHDLCVVDVSEDLHVTSRIATEAPSKYDDATIIGHPHLLPTIITKGHFSSKRAVDVQIGVRACKPEDYKNPSTTFLCIFAGGFPIIRNYETIVVSALIMPGSSGSAIYNSSGEISAVVFAGSSDLGYALAVPYEYVMVFLQQELPTLTPIRPNTVRGLASEKQEEEEEIKAKLQEACENATNPEIKRICAIIEGSEL